MSLIKSVGSKLASSTAQHLLIGGCILAGCELCSGGAGMSRSLGLQPYTLNDNAKQIWVRNKSRLLRIWQDSAGPQPGVSGLSANHYRGAGRNGLVCYAELVFEAATFPKLDRSWPRDIRSAWSELRDQIKVDRKKA